MPLFDILFDEDKLGTLNQVELADLCSVLWDAYFANDFDNNIAVKYNKAASQYNKNAGASMLSAITPSTVNTHIKAIDQEREQIPREKLINKEPEKIEKPKQERKSAPAVLQGSYSTTTEPMPLTSEIQAILAQDVPGAVKIREVYLLNPEGFNPFDFEKYSGINQARIKGCLTKFVNKQNEQ